MALADDQRRGTAEAVEVGEGGGVPLYETSELKRYSPTMYQLPPIDKSHAQMWVKYWKSRKYL